MNEAKNDSPGWFARLDCELIWDLLTSEPGLGVAVLRSDATLEYVNQVFAAVFCLGDHRKILGRPIVTLVPHLVAQDMISSANRVRISGRALIRRTIWRGRRLQAKYGRFPNSPGGIDGVVITVRQTYEDPHTPADVAPSNWVELGTLDVLTDRELEVLGLIGQGLRTGKIAKFLHRSPKTIDAHMVSIRSKLDTRDRAVLMRIANEAGLEDCSVLERTRVRASQPTTGDP